MRNEGDHLIVKHEDKGLLVDICGDQISQMAMLSTVAVSVQRNMELNDAEFMALLFMTFKETKKHIEERCITIDEGQIKDIIEHEKDK